MEPPSTSRSRRRRTPPKEIKLIEEKDNSLGYVLFRPAEAVEIAPSARFVVLPGSKGFGWVLHIYEDDVDERS